MKKYMYMYTYIPAISRISTAVTHCTFLSDKLSFAPTQRPSEFEQAKNLAQLWRHEF